MQCTYGSYLVFDVREGVVVGFDDQVVYNAEDHCIVLVFLSRPPYHLFCLALYDWKFFAFKVAYDFRD